jgi:hypothetical protein
MCCVGCINSSPHLVNTCVSHVVSADMSGNARVRLYSYTVAIKICQGRSNLQYNHIADCFQLAGKPPPDEKR